MVVSLLPLIFLFLFLFLLLIYCCYFCCFQRFVYNDGVYSCSMYSICRRFLSCLFFFIILSSLLVEISYIVLILFQCLFWMFPFLPFYACYQLCLGIRCCFFSSFMYISFYCIFTVNVYRRTHAINMNLYNVNSLDTLPTRKIISITTLHTPWILLSIKYKW